MEKEITIGKLVNFCSKCNWNEINNSEDRNLKCEKCNSYCWTIYKYKYYKNGKLIAKEEGLTDNDENDLHSDSLIYLKKIFDRGLKLLK